jgi:hypothetical protein
MQFNAIILAAADTNRSDNLPLLIALAATVLAVIALIRVSALGQELKKPAPATNPQPAPPPAPAAKTTASAAPEAVSIPPEIVAVIAAAVAACAGRNIRIVSIRPSSSSWERAGRQAVLTSHRIR